MPQEYEKKILHPEQAVQNSAAVHISIKTMCRKYFFMMRLYHKIGNLSTVCDIIIQF